MSTGYTCSVADGEITTLRPFILACARAFGAAILQREDPNDAPLKTHYEPDTYHKTQLAVAEEALRNVKEVSLEEAERLSEKAYREALKSYEGSKEKEREVRERYESMLKMVRAWKIPSPDHGGLKKFMIEQLETSINFDCNGAEYRSRPKKSTAKEFLEDLRERAEQDVAYHKKEWKAEQKRTEDRNRWLQGLVDSLPEK